MYINSLLLIIIRMNKSELKVVSSNIVAFPLAKKVFTYGEYDNFFSKSPKFTWGDYQKYKHVILRSNKMTSLNFIKLEDIVSFK